MKSFLTAFAITSILMTAPASAQDAAVAGFRAEIFTAADGRTLPYRVATPKEGPRLMPLVLFLHGSGERGDDNFLQLKNAVTQFTDNSRTEQYPAIILAPQCPKDHRWVEKDWNLDTGTREVEDPAADQLVLVRELVESYVATGNIDPQRIYLTGLSMGAFGGWHLLTMDPDRYAAAVLVCGGGNPRKAESYQSTPLWVLHGGDDPVVPVKRSREMIAAIATSGHQGDLFYTEYPGVQHDSWTPAFGDRRVHQWLFDQVRQR